MMVPAAPSRGGAGCRDHCNIEEGGVVEKRPFQRFWEVNGKLEQDAEAGVVQIVARHHGGGEQGEEYETLRLQAVHLTWLPEPCRWGRIAGGAHQHSIHA